MSNWTREEAIAFAVGAVRTAREDFESGEYETLSAALDSHRGNALETINENGGREFNMAAYDAFEAEAAKLAA